MKLITILIPLVPAAGCVQTHRQRVVYTPAPATVVAPTSDRSTVRVYAVPAPAETEIPATSVPLDVPAGRDLAVAGSIRRMIENDPSFASISRNVDMAVDKAQVTLRGRVASAHERQEIQDRIARIPGVAAVNNHLQFDLR